MIGGAVLIVGLLLILAGLASARIPGEATFASSGIRPCSGSRGRHGGGTARPRPAGAQPDPRLPALADPPRHLVRERGDRPRLLRRRLRASRSLVSIASAGFATIVAGIGVVLVAVVIEGSRLVARIERRRVMFGAPRSASWPIRTARSAAASVELLRAEFADENRWRDVLYVAVNFPLSIIEFFVVATVWAIALWLLTMPLWYDAVAGTSLPVVPRRAGRPRRADRGHPDRSSAPRCFRSRPRSPSSSWSLHRAVVAGLLCTSESRELRRQVETLKESRSAVLDVEASELHRIERDLHDGAQQRLVMLTIDLGLASERIDTDPGGRQAARRSRARSRPARRWPSSATWSAASPRPSCSIAAWCRRSARSRPAGPCRRSVRSDLPPGERLPAAIERAAYFVVAEALANVAKHSGARSCEVRCRRDGSRLIVEVSDDGAGGATVEPGGGLAGLAGRVAGRGRHVHGVQPGRRSDARAGRAAGGRLGGPADLLDRAGRSGPQVGQHREHAAVVVLRVGQLELAEDAADVLLGRALGDPEQRGDARRWCGPRPWRPAPRAREASAPTAGRRPAGGPSAGRPPPDRGRSRRGRLAAGRP